MSVFVKPENLVNRNRAVFPEFDYLQRNLESNTNALTRHITGRMTYIDNSNLIANAIYGMPEREEQESDAVYHDRIKGLVTGQVTALGLVHDAGFGQVTEGNVYSGINEYFLSVESDYKPNSTDVGLRIISHPYTGDKLLDFTNVTTVSRISKPKEFFAFFTIDLALLVLNYSRYVIKERAKLKPNESLSDPIGNFIRDIVFPSLVVQHQDLVFANKFTRLLSGEYLIEPKGLTDISIASFSDKTDDILEDYLGYVTGDISNIEQLLVLEMPSGRMFWDLMLEQDDKLQRTNWFYYMANYRYYAFIILVIAIKGLSTEMEDMHKFKYELNNLRNFREVLGYMTDESKDYYNQAIKNLISLSNDV